MDGWLIAGLGAFLVGLGTHVWFWFHRRPATRLVEHVYGRPFVRKGKNMIAVPMNTTQKFALTVKATLADKVTPGVIDAAPTYPVDHDGVVQITVAPDGLSAVVSAVAVGVTNITPTATANGKTIVGDVIQVTVTAPPPPFAETLVVTVGPVEPQ
jgi:hypothetical protein